MNSQELFHKDGKSSGVWYCSACKKVAPNEAIAEKCCKKNVCKCGAEIAEPYYLSCKICRIIEDEKREKERLEKAEKVTEWDGPVYLDGTSNEGYAPDLEHLLEQIIDDEEELPLYVWTCTTNPVYHRLTADRILEREEDGNVWEYFDRDDVKGEKELDEAINKFKELNKGLVFWEVNYKKALIL